MSRPRFLLTGAASELSLGPLADALRQRGLAVALIDLALQPLTRESAPPGDGPLVLVTSQHLTMTGDVYDEYSSIKTYVATPQSLRARVGADLMVYVPHDPGEPLLPGEVPLLALFDLYVAVDDSAWWARAHVPTVVAGWVGAACPEAGMEAVPASVADRGILFVSAVRWLLTRGGGPFLVRSLRRTLDHGLAVKLPFWPGLEGFESALAAVGAELVDPRIPATRLIARAPLVVTTASGGVVAEASLAGHRPICVLPPGAETEPALLADLPLYDAITCRDTEFPDAVASAGRIRAGRATFDTDAFLAAVQQRMTEGARV